MRTIRKVADVIWLGVRLMRTVVVFVVAVAARCRLEEVDAVGDLLHRAVEPVAEAAGEVDQSAGDLAVGALEVHDDRLTFLELVGDLLGLVEPTRANRRRVARTATVARVHPRLRARLHTGVVVVTSGLRWVEVA